MWSRGSEALLPKCENPDLNPLRTCKKPGMAMGVPATPVLWKQREASLGLASGRPVPVSVRDSASRNKVESRTPIFSSVLCTFTHPTHECVYAPHTHQKKKNRSTKWHSPHTSYVQPFPLAVSFPKELAL